MLFFPEDFIVLMENLFFGVPAPVADPLGEVGGEASLAWPCISSSAVHWPGGDAFVEPFMLTVNKQEEVSIVDENDNCGIIKNDVDSMS